MRAGRLDQRITIQTPTSNAGTRGQRIDPQWENLHITIPASIVELSGRELELSKQYVPTATHEIRIRYHTNINEACRCIWGDRILSIGHIYNPTNRRHELRMVCEERKAKFVEAVGSSS